MKPRAQLAPEEQTFIDHLRVARLATADASGHPHAVPVCFARVGEHIFIALDEKPKRVAPQQLARVRNIMERPEADLLFDRYADDWSLLGFVRVHGPAELVRPGEAEHSGAIAHLQAKYPQYERMRIAEQPVIAVSLERVASWGNLALSAVGALQAPAGGSASGRDVAFLPLAEGRRSVRKFLPRPVERGQLMSMVEAARWAPSPHGRQPWRFAIITRRDVKERLADEMGAEWRRNLAMDGQSEEVVAIRLAKSRARIVEAPALVLACLRLTDLDVYPDAERQMAETTMAIQSLGCAIQNMLLAAYADGLDTGWVCAPLFCPDVVRRALDLERDLIPHALITIGYAATDPVRRAHRPVSELLVRFD